MQSLKRTLSKWSANPTAAANADENRCLSCGEPLPCKPADELYRFCPACVKMSAKLREAEQRQREMEARE